MSPKRSNKTARVLNLISKSDNEVSDVETNTQDTINSNNNMSEDAIADLLAKHDNEQNNEQNQVKETTSENLSETTKASNETLSDDSSDTLFAQNSQEKQPEKTQTEQSDIKEQTSQTSAELPPAPQPVVPILQNVREQESHLEDQICSDLLSNLELEEQTIKRATKPEVEDSLESTAEPENVSEPASEPDSNAILSDDSIAALFAQNNGEPEKSNDNTQTVENKAESTQENTGYFGATAHGKRSVRYVNVIQELVEEEAKYSLKMLACNCPRCLADMKALTLTNLPSKYVVIDDEQKNGILRIYSSKYSRLISVEMMKSCVIVNENPHH